MVAAVAAPATCAKATPAGRNHQRGNADKRLGPLATAPHSAARTAVREWRCRVPEKREGDLLRQAGEGHHQYAGSQVR
nr:hypothetical protein [Tanacetum cinerariifolium]